MGEDRWVGEDRQAGGYCQITKSEVYLVVVR